LQEGISSEALSYAGHEKLDNLIVLYDSNDITLDNPASFTQSDDVIMRFESYGFDVIQVNQGNDINDINSAILKTIDNKNGKPKVIIFKTLIGKGIKEVEGKTIAHGEGGIKYIENAKKSLNLPIDQNWYVSDNTKKFFDNKKIKLNEKYLKWKSMFNEWEKENPEKSKLLSSSIKKERKSTVEILSQIPYANNNKGEATRQSGSTIINYISDVLPTYISGSADLHGSTKNYIKNGGIFGSPSSSSSDKSYEGKNVLYGIREHAMGGICNGISYGGIFTPSCATFLVFADYMRPAIRLASISELPVSYILTHDSIGVGEDGPTHQPVETTSGLRLLPNLDVIRPADYEETAAAYTYSITKTNGPTALILTRQNVPLLQAGNNGDDDVEEANMKRLGTLRGAYILKKETKPLTHIFIASGSEVQYILKASNEMDNHESIRVISMPSMSLFDKQTNDYKEFILPSTCTKRLAMEAGVSHLWYKYVGLNGKVMGVDKFGMSAPGDITYKQFKMTVEDVIATAKTL
jgi:transketolase